MRTRFKKVWCGSCSSMQFAGECPHGRVVNARMIGQREGGRLSNFDRDALDPAIGGRSVMLQPLRLDPEVLRR